MKQLIIFLIFVALAFSACNDHSQTTEEQKEEYLKSVEIKLEKFEDNILGLRERADNILTARKAEFDAKIDSLAQKQDVAESKLAELRDASAENWPAIKSEMENLMAKIDSLREATRDW